MNKNMSNIILPNFEKHKLTTRPLLRVVMIVFIYTGLSVIQIHLASKVGHFLMACLMGIILSGCLNLAHECLHLTFMKSKGVNRWFGRCAAGLLLINFTLYKEHHLKHHKYVGTDRDTETNVRFKSIIQYLVSLSGIPLAIAKIPKSFTVLVGKYPSYLDRLPKIKEAHKDAWYLCAFLIFVSLFTFASPTSLALCYWFPLCFSYPFIMFFGLPEHYGCDSIPDSYSKARTIRSNTVVRFFLWNANFHAEHHLSPGIAGDNFLSGLIPQKHNIVYRENSYFLWHLNLIRALISGKNSYRIQKQCQN